MPLEGEYLVYICGGAVDAPTSLDRHLERWFVSTFLHILDTRWRFLLWRAAGAENFLKWQLCETDRRYLLSKQKSAVGTSLWNPHENPE